MFSNPGHEVIPVIMVAQCHTTVNMVSLATITIRGITIQQLHTVIQTLKQTVIMLLLSMEVTSLWTIWLVQEHLFLGSHRLFRELVCYFIPFRHLYRFPFLRSFLCNRNHWIRIMMHWISRSVAKYSIYISVTRVWWCVLDWNACVIEINLHEVLPWLCVCWIKTAFRMFGIQSSVFHSFLCNLFLLFNARKHVSWMMCWTLPKKSRSR